MDKDIAKLNFEPGYLKLHRTGELAKRAQRLWDIMKSCRLCPRQCKVDRLAGKKGFCQANSQLMVSSFHPHFGEERPLVGTGGSGTIFFAHCALRCVFCINWQISQGEEAEAISIEELAEMMLRLQKIGCHNINLVTPTHYLAHILFALDIAVGKGLRLPIVYNSCGWERGEILNYLDGVVDIYLPDFKYWDNEFSQRHLPQVKDYAEVTREAILKMHRQVGVAKLTEDNLIYRGLMIRHLVMPNRVAGTKEIIEWIANNLPKDTYLNIMSQYTPCHQAYLYPEIARRITKQEYQEVIRWAKQMGLTNLDIQGW
ncbi:MAG: radical SAM protein [Candidatus Omnitrophica bacterium]|nr:radical SAM protein [Candidatus Omnitrophota bacterium]